MKTLTFIALSLLAGCGMFHGRTPPKPDVPLLVVTGAPLSSLIFVDGKQVGPAADGNDQSREIDVPAGDHVVEVRMGDAIVYHEETYVEPGGKRVVTVLSGFQTPAGFQPMPVPQ